jgi:hypothetical protein
MTVSEEHVTVFRVDNYFTLSSCVTYSTLKMATYSSETSVDFQWSVPGPQWSFVSQISWRKGSYKWAPCHGAGQTCRWITQSRATNPVSHDPNLWDKTWWQSLEVKEIRWTVPLQSKEKVEVCWFFIFMSVLLTVPSHALLLCVRIILETQLFIPSDNSI